MFFMENYIDMDRNLVKRTGTVCEHRSYGSVKVLEYWVLVLIALVSIVIYVPIIQKAKTK